ncbi:Uncharacterized protein APZ42_016531 [Daphnia magna]|uniref:Uncharacterized protein n=1 Tax=Daphnia magna TaxID=35525 RepID=A0A165AGJ5_9CRUS|nr:Uncharacterized protein APZ42_016531 [Daphnia magna]
MVFRCFYRSIQCTIPLSFVKNCWSSGSAIVPFASIFREITRNWWSKFTCFFFFQNSFPSQFSCRDGIVCWYPDGSGH